MSSKQPPVVLDLNNDDAEFTSCKVCHSNLRSYNNTSLSKTDDVDNAFTRHLLSHNHLHCEKCGLHIDIHPDNNPSEEALIFVCSNSLPHKHCLCYECGLLYGLKPDKHQKNILSQLQYQHSTQSNSTTSADISQSQSVSLLAAHGLAGMNIVTNGTLIADVLSGAVSADSSDPNLEGNNPSGSSEPSLNSLLPLLLVWLGIYVSSPFLFRLSGIAAWFSAFYVLLRFSFADNEPVQRAVFSLYALTPIAVAGYLVMKARRSAGDVKSTLQFVAVFALCVYGAVFGSAVTVLAEVAHFRSLSMAQRIVALFIAVSVASFGVLLFKMTCCNVMLWSFVRHCVAEAPLAKDLADLNDIDIGLELEVELKSISAAETAVIEPAKATERVVVPKMKKQRKARVTEPVHAAKKKKSKASRKRRSKRKRAAMVRAE